MSLTDTADRDLSADRFAMLEMDAPSKPVAPTAQIKLPLGAPARPAAPAPVAVEPEPEVTDAAPVPDGFGTVASEGAHMAARQGLVRGGVVRADVNPGAGYNRPVIARSGEATRYAQPGEVGSRGTLPAGTPVQAAPVAPVSAPAPVVAAPVAPAPVPTAQATASYASAPRLLTNQQISDRTAKREAHVAPSLTDKTLAGGVEEGASGYLVGWRGWGERTHPQIALALQAAGLPESWLPSTHSMRAHATHAVRTLQPTWQVNSVDKREAGDDWSARWIVGHTAAAGATPGAAYGKIAAVVTLRGGALTTEVDATWGDASIAVKVQSEFLRLTSGLVHKAADVTAWLDRMLKGRCNAASYGLIYWIPRSHIEPAFRLLGALKLSGWGREWFPPIPVTTSVELRRGLADGLIADAEAILADLAARRATLRKGEDKAKDIGADAAATFMARLKTIAERAVSYATVLGSDVLGDVRERVLAAMATVEPLLSDTAQRGVLIWEALAEEAARKSAAPVEPTVPVTVEPTVEPTAPVAAPVPVGVEVSAPTVAVPVAPAPVPAPVAVEHARPIVSTVTAPTAAPRRGPQAATRTTAPTATAPTGPIVAYAPQNAIDASLDIRRGLLVRVVRGQKLAHGTEGVVMRHENGRYGWTVTLKLADGTYFSGRIAASNVAAVVDADGRPMYPSIPTAQRSA